MTPTPTGDTPPLLPQHLDDLRRSGLSDAQIRACGFRSVEDPAKIDKVLGWTASRKKIGPCLGIPFPGPDGKLNGYARLKPDRPRLSSKDQSKIRYESPRGKPNRVYFPPGTLTALADPTAALVITEGEKKAAKADQDGFPCLGLVGVYGWQQKRDGKDAPRELIPDMGGVAWKGRSVFIVYDSDVADKTDVQWAEWHLAEALREQGAAVKIVRLPGGNGGAKVGLDDFLMTLGPEAFREALAAAQPAKRPEDLRPKIIPGPMRYITVAQAIDALAKGDKSLYQRGAQLVRVAHPIRPAATSRLRGSGGPKIEPVPTVNLRTRLTRHARIIKLVPKSDGTAEEKLTHPPAWLAEELVASGSWPGIRPLEAVVSSPVLLADGSVLQRPGYHRESGLLYEPDADYPLVTERPTKADAEQAAMSLLDAVNDFPFSRPEHRAAWVASVLTPLARFSFDGPAPLFLIDGNVRGTGKGLLADVAARVATGRDFARASYAPDAVEMKKVITAIALSGERLVLLDNIGSVLGDSSLDAALTATEWQERVLGLSERPRLPLLVCWFGTGNNVALRADTGRRVCHIRLESSEENPERRSGFRHPNLLAWVQQERGRLLTAALTILSGFCHAGRPDMGLTPWGSFEGWTALVRGAVVWAGLPDPGLTREVLAERSDQDAGALRGLIAGWKEIDPDREGVTVATVLKTLEDKANASLYSTLRGVLAEVFDLTADKLPSSRKLGNTLRRFTGRNVGGECFDSRDGHGGVKNWFVRTMGGDGGTKSGGSGGSGGSVLIISAREGGGSDGIRAIGGNSPTKPTKPTTAPSSDALAGETPFILVTDPAGLETVRDALGETGVVGVDCETTSLNPRTGRVRLLTLTTDTTDGGMIVYLIDAFEVDPTSLWDALAERPIVCHNAAFDLGFLAARGFVPGVVQDTMLLSQLLDGTRRPKGYHGLAAVAERHLGRLLDKTEQTSDWSGPLTPEQLRYAAEDAAILPPLFRDMSAKVKAAGLGTVAEIERRCLPALAWLSRSGAPLDRPAWEALAAEATAKADDLAGRLGKIAPARPGSLLAGDAWNFDSPDQVKEVFAAVGVKLDCTDDDALAAVDHPLAGLIREYRAAGKLAGTYGRAWLDHVAPDGRVYAGWRQIGADSGRMACTGPNLQNLPRDPRYRRCFAAPPGRILVKADYSQIELRIGAKVAQDKAMLAAYQRGEDLHTATARRVLNVEEVTKPQRQLAKAVNFGLLFGMSAAGFRAYAHSQYGVDLTPDEAANYRRAFFDAYPGLARWHRQVRSTGAKESRTRAGRRRLFDDKTPDTQRLNSPVQGTGADGLKQALALLWERRAECPDAFPVLVVHDEIVVECGEAQADAVKQWLTRAMVDGMAPLIAPVPVEVEATVGRTWAG